MRASVSPKALVPLLLAILAFAAPLSAQIEPAFRLPIGGRPLAGPVVDDSLSPASVWILSEDLSLYLLSEKGKLLSRIPLPGKPSRFLSLDSGGRALVITEGRLSAFTRLGKEAFRVGLGPEFATAEAPPACALGSDGRLFLAAASRLLCLAPAGRQLWSLDLPSPLAVATVNGGSTIACDGAGRLLAALSDGSLLVVNPWGRVEARLEGSGELGAMGPFARAPWLGLDAETPALAALGLGDGSVLLLGPRDAVAGRVRAAEDAICAFASDGKVLYALSASGGLSAISGRGELLWKAGTGVKDGKLGLYPGRIAATGRGRAVSLSLAGESSREASFRNSAEACTLTPSGLLFSPGEDWVLGAYYFEDALGPAVHPVLPPYGDSGGAAEEELAYNPVLLTSGGRLSFLADMESLLDAGQLGAEEGRAGAVASAMATGAYDRHYPVAEARFRADPLPRSRALHLLGRLGSPERLGVIIGVFERDADPSVRSAACEAIAAIGLDPEGRAASAFSRAIAKARLDDETAFAVVGAIVDLALESGSPPGLDAMRSLLALTNRPYGQDVRNAATKALGRIAGSLAP